MAQQFYNYKQLLRQRAVLAALTFGLVAVMTWVVVDIVINSVQSQIPKDLKTLSEPLNPAINESMLDDLKRRELLGLEAVRSTALSALPSPSPSPVATASGSLELQSPEPEVLQEASTQ